MFSLDLRAVRPSSRLRFVAGVATLCAGPIVAAPVTSGPVRADMRHAAADTLQWTMVTVDSQPIRGMTIRTTKPDGTPGTFTTDSLGKATIILSPGSQAVAEAPGFRIGYIDYKGPDGDAPPKEATFHIRASLTGVVTDRQGHPVSGATVEIDTISARDAQFGSSRTPLVRVTTDQNGRFTIAPRAMYIAKGFINSSDPLTMFVSTTAPQRIAVVPLPFSQMTKAKPTVSVVLDALRPVRLGLADATGINPTQAVVEVLPQDTAAASAPEWERRSVGAARFTAVNAGRWSTTVMLPANAWYRVSIPSAGGRVLTYAPFTVPPGRDTLIVSDFKPINDAQRFAAGIAGTPAPDFIATTVDGKPVHLSDYRGKTVVLDFWGYWCEPCVEKFPALVKIANAYRDSNVVVIAMHDGSVATAADYQTHFNNTVAKKIGAAAPPFVQLRDVPLSDSLGGKVVPITAPGNGQTVSAYGITSFPTTLVIDPYGRYVGNAPNVMQMQTDATGHPIAGSMQAPEHDAALEALIQKARTAPAPK